ncbi:MAG: gamma-glutamyl-gamma-aminobutyrate hydrolase family protein [Anaerolineae bacterium]|nr:gamma-glutamyl-gamma-aminobutyrate hydrolase family protein [Anaerolineae bacterium]
MAESPAGANWKPLIGITGGCTTTGRGVVVLYAIPAYVRAVELAGGVPVVVPVTLNLVSLQALYRKLDGVVLSGGGDVLPGNYGAESASHVYGTDAQRDAAEIALARWAVRDDRPLLAICRGHQVLNVALGGTLHRHIPDAIKTDIRHDNPILSHRARLIHEVDIEPGSRLAQALDTAGTEVNSMHHQAVDQVGAGLCIVARAPDGVIEGIERPDRRFVIGVQWHPEEIPAHPAMRCLFRRFVQAAGGFDGRPARG